MLLRAFCLLMIRFEILVDRCIDHFQKQKEDESVDVFSPVLGFAHLPIRYSLSVALDITSLLLQRSLTTFVSKNAVLKEVMAGLAA